MVRVKEGDVALDFGRAERMWAMTVFIQVPSPAAEHALMQVGAPFFSVSIPFAPFTLRGKLLIGPVPWTVDGFDHAGDVP